MTDKKPTRLVCSRMRCVTRHISSKGKKCFCDGIFDEEVYDKMRVGDIHYDCGYPVVRELHSRLFVCQCRYWSIDENTKTLTCRSLKKPKVKL
tara:strand:+ start:3848 stop:4126 length:279 start_codon:yes stop_codon:yes gene_type:complete